MSPRAWWRGGRRDDEPDRPAERNGTLPDGEAYLAELAAEGATGALSLHGRWGGTVYLDRGRVAHVESALTPGVETLLLRPHRPDEERWSGLVAGLRRGENEDAIAEVRRLLEHGVIPAAHAELVRRIALADAALAVLGSTAPEAQRGRPRFRPDERHWFPAGPSEPLAAVRAEVDRRRHLLARMSLGVRVYWPVARAQRLPRMRLGLSSTEWDVVRLADGDRTPLDIAWLLGHGVFATTVVVHQLARLGILTAGPESDAAPPGPPRHTLSFLRAAQAASAKAAPMKGSTA